MSPRSLRIVHVVRQFTPSKGGLESYVSELAARQASRHKVTVLTLDRAFGERRRLAPIEQMGNVSVVRVPFLGYRRLFLPLFGPRRLKRFDVVHVHGADQMLDLVAAWVGPASAKLFMTTHGLFFHTETLAAVKRVYLRTITKWSLGRARGIFAVSRNDLSMLQDVGIQSTLLRNPIVPLGDFICEGQDLLYLGRIAPNKRVERLVRFLERVVTERPSITLHVVGPDPDGLWPQVSHEVAARGLEERVRYHGFLEAAALAEVAKVCGFFVSASRYEGFGLSAIEGMSIGLLPCLQKNIAFEETCELSGCGLLTNFDDPEAAARDFLHWMPGISRDDRRKAADFAHSQTWELVVSEYERHYRSHDNEVVQAEP